MDRMVVVGNCFVMFVIYVGRESFIVVFLSFCWCSYMAMIVSLPAVGLSDVSICTLSCSSLISCISVVLRSWCMIILEWGRIVPPPKNL